MKILFLENNATFAQTVIEEFLQTHDVVLLPSVHEGIACYRRGWFDVILVDFDLDDAKGDTFVRHVRSQGDSVPLIAVSARPHGNDALIEAGADAVCHKADFRGISKVLDAFRTAQNTHRSPIDQ